MTITENVAPVVEDAANPASETQWQLTWRAFRRHKLAVAGLIITILLYLIAIFAEFLQPFEPSEYAASAIFHPPQALHLFAEGEDGGWQWRPHVNRLVLARDPLTLEGVYKEDPAQKVEVGFLVRSWDYRLLGLIPTDIHLLGPVNANERFYLLGADRLGRDMLSRVISGTRISMSIGLVGVVMTLVLGIILGGISGYFGGKIDAAIQRVIEVILSLPTIPIWLGLAAAMPADWSPLMRYFAISLILSLVGWTELARVVRGRFLALRTEDYVTAAMLDGCSRPRVIFRHMLPAMTSHIIATVTLAVPAMILSETALSFLGLGLQPPIVSWGVLLQEVQNVRSLAEGPWLFAPAVMVLLAVLALNAMGDGMRDAVDPYSHKR